MLHRVLTPLKIGASGAEVVNLQDALLFLVNKDRLKIDDPSLRERLLGAMATERDRQVFGDNGTYQLVRMFQTQQGLPETGVVDEPTANVLNKLLEGLGAFEEPPQFAVQAQAQYTNGRPAAGMKVRAFDRDLRSEEKLGEVTTDEQGRYEIKYTAAQFSRDEKGSADLRVAVCEPGG